jgi:hypothetical protein
MSSIAISNTIGNIALPPPPQGTVFLSSKKVFNYMPARSAGASRAFLFTKKHTKTVCLYHYCIACSTFTFFYNLYFTLTKGVVL